MAAIMLLNAALGLGRKVGGLEAATHPEDTTGFEEEGSLDSEEVGFIALQAVVGLEQTGYCC